MPFHYELPIPLLPTPAAKVIDVLVRESSMIEPGTAVARLAAGDERFEVLANGIGFIGPVYVTTGQRVQAGERLALVHADGEDIPYGRPYSLLKDSTLAQIQERTCRRVQSAYVEAALNLKAGIASNVGTNLQPLNALRHPADLTTTGWYIWTGEQIGDAPDFFKPVHVMHLRERRPELLPYLGLASTACAELRGCVV